MKKLVIVLMMLVFCFAGVEVARAREDGGECESDGAECCKAAVAGNDYCNGGFECVGGFCKLPAVDCGKEGLKCCGGTGCGFSEKTGFNLECKNIVEGVTIEGGLCVAVPCGWKSEKNTCCKKLSGVDCNTDIPEIICTECKSDDLLCGDQNEGFPRNACQYVSIELQDTCVCNPPDKEGKCTLWSNGCDASKSEIAACKYVDGVCGWGWGGGDSSKARENCKCQTPEERTTDPETGDYAKYFSGTKQDPFCDGAKEDSDSPKIATALGCIPINFLEFVSWIFKNGFGIVGGIAFLLLIGAFIQLATSEGDVKKIQGVKETITSIATGLLLALFSVFIIRTLMINILQIPGLK